jgi:hypothetical protein
LTVWSRKFSVIAAAVLVVVFVLVGALLSRRGGSEAGRVSTDPSGTLSSPSTSTLPEIEPGASSISSPDSR